MELDAGGTLKRVVSRPLLTFFVLGDILGAGIYALTGEVGKRAGGAIWASFLIAFVLAFMTAFAYLELVTKYPKAAGAALYIDLSFGIHFISFLVTFAIVSASVTTASFAASRIGGDYFTGLTGMENPPTALIAIAVILLVAAVNLWGIVESLRINVVLTCVELLGLLFIIGVGVSVVMRGGGDFSRPFEFVGSGFELMVGLVAGAATAFYAFIGFEDAVNLVEETKNPSRVFPPALAWGLGLASIVYLLVAFTAVLVVPVNVLTTSTGPLLEVVRLGIPGETIDRIFSAIAMIAVSNTMLINMLMASRLLYGMANRGVIPHQFAWLSKRRTPWLSIVFSTALSVILLAVIGDFTRLANNTVLLLSAVFFMVNVSAIILRKNKVDHEHFKAPLVVLFIGAIVSAVFVTPLVREGYAYFLAAILLSIGVVLWVLHWLFGRKYVRRVD